MINPRRLCVVVREQGRILVARSPSCLQPACERCVPARALCLRETAVRDLADERVLEGVFLLTGHGGTGRAANEVALFEGAEVRLGPLQQVAERAGPEIPADDGSRLQCALLRLAEKVDARGQERLNRIGNREPGWHVWRVPAAVRSLDDALVYQHRDELLEEEGIAVGPRGDNVSKRPGQLRPEQLVNNLLHRLSGGEARAGRRSSRPGVPSSLDAARAGPGAPCRA